MTTLKQVNQALKEKFGDLELVRGKGYYYFSGKVASSWSEQGLYGGWLLKNTTVQKFLDVAQERIEKDNRFK
jgi:hypothetical protein